jgi:dihydroorotate dehydrogenase electron transfer subunit
MTTENINQQPDPKLRICKITEIIDETPSIKTFYFDDPMTATGGQFVMVWVPGVDEIPMSVSYTGSQKGITVAKVGPTTIKMHELIVGERLGIRGPYGNGFDISKADNILAVAGGCGSAPLGSVLDQAISSNKKVTFALGARNSSELLFKARALNLGIELDISTDDGSEGYHGFVTDRVAELIKEHTFDLIIMCGPEVMLKKVVEQATDNSIPVQASLERYMKCGIGICDACAINGYQVCRDGPVFTGDTLAHLTDFGSSQRDSCGRMIDI